MTGLEEINHFGAWYNTFLPEGAQRGWLYALANTRGWHVIFEMPVGGRHQLLHHAPGLVCSFSCMCRRGFRAWRRGIQLSTDIADDTRDFVDICSGDGNCCIDGCAIGLPFIVQENRCWLDCRVRTVGHRRVDHLVPRKSLFVKASETVGAKAPPRRNAGEPHRPDPAVSEAPVKPEPESPPGLARYPMERFVNYAHDQGYHNPLFVGRKRPGNVGQYRSK